VCVITSEMPTEDANGNIIGYRGTDTDITKTKIAEQRLQLNRDFQEMLSRISFDFIQSDVNNYHQKFNNLLEIVGKFMNSNRAFIFKYNSNNDEICNVFEWFDNDSEPIGNIVTNKSIDELPFLSQIKQSNDIHYLSDTNSLYDDNLKTFLSEYHISSALCLPIIRNDKFYGFFGFYSNKINPILSEINVNLFQVISNIIGDTITNIEIEMEKDIAQKALQESEEKYRLITENSLDVIWIYNTQQQKYSYISPSIYHIRGLTVEEAMNESLQDSLSTESLDLIMKALSEAFAKIANDPYNIDDQIIEIVQPHKNGNMVNIEISSRLRYNKAGDLKVVGSSRNINERKTLETQRNKALQALKDSEEKLKTIFETANIGIKLTDADGMLIMCNKWLIDYLRYDSGKLMNMTNIDITYSDDIETTINLYNRILNSKINHFRIDKRYRRDDGVIVWANLSVAPIKNDDGEVVYFVGMISDITDRKIAEEKLRSYSIELEMINEELHVSKDIIEENLAYKNQLIEDLEKVQNDLENSIKEKDKFFSIIAHDLRNPLGNFKTATELLNDPTSVFTQEEQTELLLMMKKSADNVFTLLENLLDWSRSQRGKIPFDPNDIMISKLVENNFNLLSPTANSKNILLLNNISGDAYAFADMNMINTVLRNLISNAIKFTRNDGTIEIGTSDILHQYMHNNEPMIVIYVKDKGIGIDSETKHKLFRIDENVSKTGTLGEIGTGLGLILCKEFVERNGGRIWVESEFGQGSTFYFTLKISK